MSCFPPQETRQNSAASIATSSCYSALSRKGAASLLSRPRLTIAGTSGLLDTRALQDAADARGVFTPNPGHREGGMGEVACLGLLPPLNQTRRRVYPPDSVKFTWTCVSTATGSPFSMYGLYRHCFTASIAAGASIGCPLINRRFSIAPSLLISACSSTVPWIRVCRASGGYAGCTFLISRPCDTPSETRTRCGVATFGTATGVELIMPPITPPIWPPGTPPGTPPTTPPDAISGGGDSSSLIIWTF